MKERDGGGGKITPVAGEWSEDKTRHLASDCNLITGFRILLSLLHANKQSGRRILGVLGVPAVLTRENMIKHERLTVYNLQFDSC